MILVTGASGFVGAAVVRQLLAAGHAVRALIRPTSAHTNLAGLPVEIAQGDLRDFLPVCRSKSRKATCAIPTRSSARWRASVLSFMSPPITGYGRAIRKTSYAPMSRARER
jgi:nucleoside-diphosphate-sugar epimerase